MVLFEKRKRQGVAALNVWQSIFWGKRRWELGSRGYRMKRKRRGTREGGQGVGGG